MRATVAPDRPKSKLRTALRIGLGIVLLLGMGCGKSSAPASGPAAGTLQVKGITAPPEVHLETACTPSGPELCFDAMDNNCNGVIDEGCGVRTGIIQFSIAWSDPSADVDLSVTDPRGDTVRGGGDVTKAGLAKDRNCPDGDSCQGQNTENVYLVEGELPRGVFRVSVKYARMGDVQPPIRVRFSARMGQRVYASELEFTAVQDEKIITFAM